MIMAWPCRRNLAQWPVLRAPNRRADSCSVGWMYFVEATQSISVWSLGRYLMSRLSSSASTSSGIRPLNLTAYIPRAYFAVHRERLSTMPFQKSENYVLVLCHLATQELSGSTTAMTPSKYVVVHVVRRSVLPFSYGEMPC